MVNDENYFLHSVDRYRDFLPEETPANSSNQNQELFCECNLVSLESLVQLAREKEVGRSLKKLKTLLAELKIGSGCGSCLKNCPPEKIFQCLLTTKE